MAAFPISRVACEALEPRALLSVHVVATDGDDFAAGDAAHPWRTLQHAADEAQPGDTVVVRKGTYAGFCLSWNGPEGGTRAKPITFRARKGVVINSRNPITPDGINLEAGSNYVTLRGFRVDNTGDGSITRAGIRVVVSDHVTIEDNVARGTGRWGILTGFADDLTIRDNVTSHIKVEHGIYVGNSGDRPRILNNRVFSNRGNGIHINGDVSLGGDGIISGALISGNVVYNNGTGGGSGINCDGVQDSRIQNNLLYDNHASGISLYRINGGGSSKNNVVVNNTVVQASDAYWALNIQDGSTGNQVFNNILLNRHPRRGSIDISANSRRGFESDHNVLMSRFTTDAEVSVLTAGEWRVATGQDAHSVVATASDLFVNPGRDVYQLRAKSPALDRGSGRLAPERDLLNRRRRPARIDIGAYERRPEPPQVVPTPP